MIEERQILTTDLERVKDFFVDPRNPQSAEDLVQIGGDAIRVMAQIYSTAGQIESMPPKFRDWLQGIKPGMSELESVTGEVLRMEAKTRRFDEMFMGQIHPQGSKIGIISNLVAAYMNNNLIVEDVSQSERVMERESIRWLAEILGYETDLAGGNIVTGGTEANEIALMVAREKLLDSMGLKNPLKRVKNPVQMYVLTSRWKHYSISKKCDELGIGLLEMPSDDFKINVRATEKAVRKLRERGKHVVAIVGLAGETETGAIEDLEGLAEVAHNTDIYFHVDAAYGGPFVLSRRKDLFKGIEYADSVTIDPHKMLYTPYPAGAIVFRNASDQDYLHTDTRYLGAVASTSSGSRSTAGTISTYATIKLLGNDGIATLLNHTLDLVETAYHYVEDSRVLRALHEPELNTMLIGLTDDVKTRAAQRGIDGKAYDDMICAVIRQIDNHRSRNPYVSNNSDVDPEKRFGRIGKRSVFIFITVHPFTTH